MTKARTTITISKELLKKARKHEINISSFLDIELRRYIALIEGKHTKNQSKKQKWTCRDLNPRPPPCQGGDLPS